MPLSRIQNSPNSIFDLVFHFWDQLNTFKNLTNSAQLSVIIMNSTKYIFKALLLLIEVLGFDLNMVNFLRSHGLRLQIARLTDQDLISVGVTTIGGRMRIRSAAANWAPTLVSCIVLSLLQMIVFYVF